MSSDSDTDRSASDARQDDEVYVENEAGEPGLAGRGEDREGIYQGYAGGGVRIASPNVYVPALLVGAVLLLVPEPLTSTLGIALLLIGGFIAVIDALSAS